MSLAPSLRVNSGFSRFNDVLRTLTGNDYETYTDLCSGMAVLNEPLLSEPGKAALNFIMLFGLKVLPEQAGITEIDKVSNLNRYASAMYAFSEESEWSVADRGFVYREHDGEMYRLRVESADGDIPVFVLDKGAIVAPERITKLGTLKRAQFSVDVTDPEMKKGFTEVSRGSDIADLMTDALLPEMKPEIEESVKKDIDGAGFDATSAMIGSVNRTKSKSHEPGY